MFGVRGGPGRGRTELRWWLSSSPFAPSPTTITTTPPARLQGCWQLCLESLLAGGSTTAVTFLQGGCGALKAALGLDPLFLVRHAADPSMYTQDGMQCIW